jgi:hypothetical protein
VDKSAAGVAGTSPAIGPTDVHLMPVHWAEAAVPFAVGSGVTVGVGDAVAVGTAVAFGAAVAVGASVGESEGTADGDSVGAAVAPAVGDEAALTQAVRRSGTTSDIARTLSNPEHVRPL